MGGCWEYLEFSQKNKPQGNALSGGVFLMLVSGFQIGWIMDNRIHKLPWTEGHTDILVNIAAVGFYATAILGLYAASMTVNRLSKKNIYVSIKFFCCLVKVLD